MFSGDRVDAGTKLLLLEAPAPPDAAATCSTWAAATGPSPSPWPTAPPAATVWAVDVNERAVALCAENARGSGTRPTSAPSPPPRPTRPPPPGCPPTCSFAAIYSNPPIRIGKAALHELLAGWLARLAPDGVAYLVVQKHLGSDSLARWLTDAGLADHPPAVARRLPHPHRDPAGEGGPA